MPCEIERCGGKSTAGCRTILATRPPTSPPGRLALLTRTFRSAAPCPTLPAVLVVLPTARNVGGSQPQPAELRRFRRPGRPDPDRGGVDQLRSRLPPSSTRAHQGTRGRDQIVEAACKAPFQHPSESSDLRGSRVGHRAGMSNAHSRPTGAAAAHATATSPPPGAPAPAELVPLEANERAAPLALMRPWHLRIAHRDFVKPCRVARREFFADPGFVRLTRDGTILTSSRPASQGAPR